MKKPKEKEQVNRAQGLYLNIFKMKRKTAVP
jgi:hypothetical protein